MAAGIGEASAILTVAQLGISLSKSLIAYIEEVKGGPSYIQRVGNEIRTTSERLKDIGELISENSHTKVFSEEGINSALRCSRECQQIIQDVRIVLYKGGWQDSDEDTLDTSLFSTLRWPFVKVKLDVPRAELHRIKIDLSLLFSAAMVLKASTTVEKQRVAQDIPGLHKARAWAAKRAEVAKKEMAQDRPRNTRARGAPWLDDEPEILEEFLTFKEKRFREEEEQRIRERAKIIQAEEDAKKRREEEAKREIERKAVEEYKSEQQEQEKRSAEKRADFRKELERLGLESAQIQMVMESSHLDFQASSATAFVPEVRPSFSPGELSGELETTPSATSGRSRLSLPWWRSKKSTRESSPEPSLDSMLSESSTGPNAKREFQTWQIDVYSIQGVKFLPTNDWLNAKLKAMKKDEDVWSRFAKLRPYWRNAILDFLVSHNENENPEWTLYHLWIPLKWSRARLFGQRREEQLIQLLLSRRRVSDEDADMPGGRLKSEGPGNSLPKRVSFARELEQKPGTERELKATSDSVSQMKDFGLSKRIARLEEKRSKLGVHDQEEIGDLNDMIAYLRDRMKSDATHPSALNNSTLQDERSPLPQPTPVRSESTRTPSIIYEKRIPNHSRQDDIDMSRGSISRPRTYGPRRRSSDAYVLPITSQHPRVTETMEIDSRPGKTDHEGRHGSRKSSQNEVDTMATYRDHDRASQRGLRERPRERNYGEEEIPFRWDERERDREWTDDEVTERGERSRGPPRERERDFEIEEIIVERDSRRPRSLSYERESLPISSGERKHPRVELRGDFRDDDEIIVIESDDGERVTEHIIIDRGRNRSREMIRQREEKAWSPEREEVLIRRNERSKSKPRERKNSSSSGSKYSYSGSRVHRGQPIVGESSQSKALVLRAGASGLPYEYIRGRVSNGGIRVRGDDYIGSPRPKSVNSAHARRPSQTPISRRGSYRDRSWAPLLRRRNSEWHQLESSEDDEYKHTGVKRTHMEVKGSETEASDAEVIAQTLKKFTTIQDSDMPATDIAAPPMHQRRVSDTEVGPSALKNPSLASPVPEPKKSLPVPGRKPHFEQESGLPQPHQEGQTRVMHGRSKSVDGAPFLDEISEEPDLMDDTDDIPHEQRDVYFPERPVLPRPRERPPFSLSSDLAHRSREASPRPQSGRNSNLDSPRTRPADGPIILEHGGYTLSSQEEVRDHAVEEEEGYDEVENLRQISRNPTVREDVD